MKFIKSIRENLKDPKKKSLTLLGIYFIFFIVVFLLLSSAPKTEPNITEPKIDKVTSYEYIYNLSDDINTIEIIGTHKDSEDLFTYNGVKYYKKENILYTYQDNKLIETSNLLVNIDEFGFENIEKIIKSSVVVDETKYSDKSSKINYNANIDNLNILNIKDTNSDILIPIEVKSNNYIEEVSIDLTNYYKHKYIINIKYDNINKIDNIKVGTN